VKGSGIPHVALLGRRHVPLRDAVRLMIAFSDNTATKHVLDQIAIPSTNTRMDKTRLQAHEINAKVSRGARRASTPNRPKKFGLGSTTAGKWSTARTHRDRKVASPRRARR